MGPDRKFRLTSRLIRHLALVLVALLALMPGKMTAYDTDIHVPLVITGPGVPAGLTVEEIVENTDLCPIFVELGGGVVPPASTGRSLVALLHGQRVAEWRTVALIEHRGPHKEATDSDELRNTFSSLAGEERMALHATLEALRTCHDAKSCQAAERGGRGAMAR